MLYLNPNLYSPQFVKDLQESVQETLLSGVQLTEFISEGTQLQGISAYSVQDILNAIDYYWDEVNGVLITQTYPNFLSRP